MVARALLIDAGLLLLGIVLLAVGAILEPARSATNPINETAESLIAFGLTLVLASVGYFLAWANPTSA